MSSEILLDMNEPSGSAIKTFIDGSSRTIIIDMSNFQDIPIDEIFSELSFPTYDTITGDMLNNYILHSLPNYYDSVSKNYIIGIPAYFESYELRLSYIKTDEYSSISKSINFIIQN